MSASNRETFQHVSVSIGAKIAPAEARQIRELIEAGVYLKSRILLGILSGTGYRKSVIKCRNVDYETAKKEILGYYRSRGEAYPDEAAEDLELDFDMVMKATEELQKEGRLVEA